MLEGIVACSPWPMRSLSALVEGDFGDCCGSDGKCGSWAFGPNAEDVEWPDMPITGI